MSTCIGLFSAPRIKLNIVAGTPIVILPGSSLSTKVCNKNIATYFTQCQYVPCNCWWWQKWKI